MGAYNTARPIAQNAPDLVIAPSPNFPLTSTLNENGSLPRPDQDSIKGAGAFGSSHPGVFNVCFGDGSVRTFSVDIDVDEFALLGRVQDGQMAVLP